MTQRERRRRHARAAALALSAALLLGVAWLPEASAQAQRDNAYQQWEQLPPQQRERILREQERFRRLPPGEQERLRREYEQRRKEER